MKYALIGCGRIATNHVKAVINNHLEFVAACDILSESIESLLEKHGLEKEESIARYTDYKQMLKEHPELDLVAIATDSGVHAQIALYCIDQGVNVIIEKPMAMSMSDADEIIRRSNEKGVKVTVCHQNRFNIAVQEMRQALEAGRFGRISHGSINVRWNREKQYYDQALWRGKWASDGGCLFNQCIHGIDLLRWMMGDEGKAICGVQIMLTGHIANFYDISYRVNLQNSGWQEWVSNGTVSGPTEEPVIGLEVKLEAKQGEIRDTAWTITEFGDDDGRQSEFYTKTNNDDGTLIVIDGGWDENTEQVRSIINLFGCNVDYWFLTHYDADHVSAFNNIYADPQGIMIGTIYATPLDYDLYCSYAAERWWDTPEVYKLFLDQTAGDERIIYLARGDSFEIAGLQIDVFNAYDQMIADYEHPDVANLASLVFKITGKEDSMLFCGDMLAFLGMDLLDVYGDSLDADYVQPGHHGNIDIPYEFYGALNPQVMFFDGPAWLNESDEYYSKGLIEWCQANDIVTYDFGTAPNSVSFE